MRLISSIDTAMPDVGNRWHYHARWNDSERLWEQDFRQLADCGFDLLRWQVPWSLVEPRRREYHWELIDPKVELASRLGLEIFYPVVHFNIPSWIAGDTVQHSVCSDGLSDAVAEYTDAVLSRYRFRLVIPIVEVETDAFQRGAAGNWQPHERSQAAYRRIHQNLITAFRAGAEIARSHNATVFCSEPASAIDTVLDLRGSFDIAGIDLYPHMHRELSILGHLRRWWSAAQRPLCIGEFGTPETYDPISGRDDYDRFITAGVDRHRLLQARELRHALVQAEREGIPIPFGGWYPGIGNVGWGNALTQERKGVDCDRAGLVDLVRQPDGSLRRVLCTNLVREVMEMREADRTTALPLTRPARPALVSGDLTASNAPVEPERKAA